MQVMEVIQEDPNPVSVILASVNPFSKVYMRWHYYLYFIEIIERQTITFCVLPLTGSRRV